MIRHLNLNINNHLLEDTRVAHTREFLNKETIESTFCSNVYMCLSIAPTMIYAERESSKVLSRHMLCIEQFVCMYPVEKIQMEFH